jgi:hypothetical protein
MSDPRRLPPRYAARRIAGRWYVIDRKTGARIPCTDRPAAADLAAMLEGVRRLLEAS